MRKVQVAAFIIAVFGVGCETSPEDEQTRDPGRFGNTYEIVLNEAPALPDEPPALVEDTLIAHVAYPGGCTDHDFELDTEVRGDTARLWLYHDAHGDDCEAWIQDRIEMRVSEDVRNAKTVLLLNPNADEPFVLRWGRTFERSDTAR